MCRYEANKATSDRDTVHTDKTTPTQQKQKIKKQSHTDNHTHKQRYQLKQTTKQPKLNTRANLDVWI